MGINLREAAQSQRERGHQGIQHTQSYANGHRTRIESIVSSRKDGQSLVADLGLAVGWSAGQSVRERKREAFGDFGKFMRRPVR